MWLLGAGRSTAGRVLNPEPNATVTLSASFFSARLPSVEKPCVLEPRPADTKKPRPIDSSNQTFILLLPCLDLLIAIGLRGLNPFYRHPGLAGISRRWRRSRATLRTDCHC